MYASLEHKTGVVRTCVSHICLRECVRVPRWLLKKALVATGNVSISIPGGSRLVVRLQVFNPAVCRAIRSAAGLQHQNCPCKPFHGDNGAIFRGQFSATSITIEI